MPSHVDTIPYSRIADIDFTAPKPVISQTKSGAHLNNNCPMISDPIEVEQPYSSCHSAVIPSFNANNRTNRKSKMLFFNKIAKCKHKPCCLSLLSPFSDSYVPNAVISATINYFIYYPKWRVNLQGVTAFIWRFEFDLSSKQFVTLKKPPEVNMNVMNGLHRELAGLPLQHWSCISFH